MLSATVERTRLKYQKFLWFVNDINTWGSLGIDLYLWLSYRIFSLRVPLQLSWRQLYRQFGTNPANATDKRIIKIFRRQALRELKKIQIAWPELNYTTVPGLLILHPSTPAIPPASRRPKLVS